MSEVDSNICCWTEFATTIFGLDVYGSQTTKGHEDGDVVLFAGANTIRRHTAMAFV